MKNMMRSLLFIFITTLFTVHAYPQLDVNTVFGAGKGLAGKINNGKKKKNIEGSLVEVAINGKMVTILRVDADKIISSAKPYIIKIQEQLSGYYKTYQQQQPIAVPTYNDDIPVVRNMDIDWPVQYYEAELAAYRAYEQQLIIRENKRKDSIAAVVQLARQRTADSLLILQKNNAEHSAYLDRVKGFHFINKEFALLREKPAATSKVIGRIYVGSYVKVTGYSDGSNFVKISLQDIDGFVDAAELVDDISKITVAGADIKSYESRQYYKYLPNYDYVPTAVAAVETDEAPAVYSAPKTKTTTTKKQTVSSSRNYIRGPRGGCYYINSGGNKVYVDRGLCN